MKAYASAEHACNAVAECNAMQLPKEERKEGKEGKEREVEGEMGKRERRRKERNSRCMHNTDGYTCMEGNAYGCTLTR